MMEMLKKITMRVLTNLYGQFGFALLLTICLMFWYLYAKENGWKNTIRQWLVEFRKDKEFRHMFCFILWMVIIISSTLWNRDVWMNPLSNVMGGWNLYNEEGNLTTEAIENILLFIPALGTLFLNFHQKIFNKGFNFWFVILKSIYFAFSISLLIELCQLFFHLGTFQFSDLIYNTLGGMVGGILYWFYYKIWHSRKKK